MLDFKPDVGYVRCKGAVFLLKAFIDFREILLYKLNVCIDLSCYVSMD